MEGVTALRYVAQSSVKDVASTCQGRIADCQASKAHRRKATASKWVDVSQRPWMQDQFDGLSRESRCWVIQWAGTIQVKAFCVYLGRCIFCVDRTLLVP